MDFQICEYEDIDTKEWNNFVKTNPNGNFFQIPELYEVYKNTKNYTPIFLAVTNKKEGILALLLAHVITEFGGPLGYFSSRAIIQGGPIFEESELGYEALRFLIKEYDKIARKKALYTEIRNTFDRSQIIPLYQKNGYVFKDHLNILVNLRTTQNEIWAALSKSRRRFIRKAKENDVLIEEISNVNQIPIFYNLLKKTYNDAKLPIADISLFYSAFSTLYQKNLIKFFMAKHSDEYIGGIMTPIYKGVITEWYVTGSRRHSKLYPSDIVTWYPIEWGVNNGFSVFDFGGAGEPNTPYGVREFKKQFGGEMLNLGRFQKIYAPNKMWITEKGFKLWKKIC